MSSFCNAPAKPEIYTLSLHDALPICNPDGLLKVGMFANILLDSSAVEEADRKSTRLNSSHQIISYAVFCLKKKIAPPLVIPLRPACSRPGGSRPHANGTT